MHVETMKLIIPKGLVPCRLCKRGFQSHISYIKHYQKPIEGFAESCNACKKILNNPCEHKFHLREHKRTGREKKALVAPIEEVEYASEEEDDGVPLEEMPVYNEDSNSAEAETNEASAENQNNSKKKSKSSNKQLFDVKSVKKSGRGGIKALKVDIEFSPDEYALLELLRNQESTEVVCPICKSAFANNMTLRFHARDHGRIYFCYFNETKRDVE